MTNKIQNLPNRELRNIRYRLSEKLDRDVTQNDLGAVVGYTGPTICTFEKGVKVPDTLAQLMRFIDKADDKTVKEILGL
jgi:predicted transcriptional regulator